VSGEAGPIIVGGLSHSGKTPVRIVLGAHPDIAMTRRTYLWDRFYGRFGDLTEPRNLARCLDALLADSRARRLRPDRSRITRDLATGPVGYARLFGLLHEHHAEGLGKRRWGEQLGFVERYAEDVFAAFPSARMIHMVRDPRARLVPAGAGTARGRATGRTGWETARWLHSARLAERNRRRHPQRYAVVRYEALASRPEQCLRGIAAFVGVELTASMRAALAAIRWEAAPVGPAGPAALEVFVERHARREMRALSYPAGAAVTAGTLAYLADWPLNRTSMAAWHALKGRS
jgi:hypothetical protein